jgi:uncharacterized protein (TIGR03067 family)
MRFHILGLLAIGLLVAMGSARSDDTKAPNLEGVWKLQKGEQGGEDIPEEAAKSAELKIKGNTFTFKLGEFEGEGKIKVDFSKKPATVDSEMTGGQASGQTYQGISEMVDENTMKQCYANPGDDRPTKFSTKEGKGAGQFYFVWKREKAGDKK